MNHHERTPLRRWRPLAAGASLALVTSMLATGPAHADDGGGGLKDSDPPRPMPIMKSMSHEGNPDEVDGYVNENEHAFIQMMKFYVPIQAANGSTEDDLIVEDKLDPRDYLNIDGDLVDSRELAKPLIGVYLNGPVEGVEDVGFSGFGLRDAYGAVSLDDGVTWKNTNLSQSAGESSIEIDRDDIALYEAEGLEETTGEEPDSTTFTNYPGDATNIFHAVAGNKVLVAWQSKFCSTGQPNYSLDNPDATDGQIARRTAIADYLGIDLSSASPDDLYLIDMYKVGGKQGSVDYAEDKWEQNHVVGEVPFNCLWTARGELVQGDDPRTAAIEASYMRWFNAERLTSGRRDVNRIETKCVEGAGCAITWQEDPEGLRPGQGEGPGEGWSGAIANSQTDVWYSYIDWENFDVVQDPADDDGATPMLFPDYEAAAVDTAVIQKPKPFVPFAMPMRMTDNAKCNPDNPAPYCFGSALQSTHVDPTPGDPADDPLDPMAYGLKDMCSAIIEIPAGKDHDGDGEPELKPVCVTEDGLPLVGNTASTRPRLGLFGYNEDGTTTPAEDGFEDAFVVVVAEEDKGLGAFGFRETDGSACTPTDSHDEVQDPDCIPFDEGKNMWYHSFGMSLTDGFVDHEDDGLLANLTFHGNMLNQPQIDWTTGAKYDPQSTADMWGFGEYDYEIYNTEIARRGSLLAQDIDKALNHSQSGLIALPTWKQGIMNQGGPADVMSRRIIRPKKWTPKKGNPYAFSNMECESWAYTNDDNGGSNPNYPDGLCLDPAVNLSATTPDTCIDSTDGSEIPCPSVDENGIGDTNPILQGKELDDGDENTKDSNTTKVLTWHQCQEDGTYTSPDGTAGDCGEDSDLTDQSWYNPLDVAKGHRGFLDGDFVMMLYAWSPNWRLNVKGSDRYELYVRRSFDGGEDWTTLPKSSFTASDGVTYEGNGTTTCETYRLAETGTQGEVEEPHACTSYEQGDPEQARNVTQLKSMKFTTLDPRFAPTAGTIAETPSFGAGWQSLEDDRDPSRYFIAYETGDNTTTQYGEPEPLDLFYSRAINFGDDYVVWYEGEDSGNGVTNFTDGVGGCYPSDPHLQDVPAELIGSEFCNEFDQLDRGTPGVEASEASLTANPGGEFLYSAWAQLEHEEDELIASDATARRVWWIDGWISDTWAWDFGQGPNLTE